MAHKIIKQDRGKFTAQMINYITGREMDDDMRRTFDMLKEGKAKAEVISLGEKEQANHIDIIIIDAGDVIIIIVIY